MPNPNASQNTWAARRRRVHYVQMDAHDLSPARQALLDQWQAAARHTQELAGQAAASQGWPVKSAHVNSCLSTRIEEVRQNFVGGLSKICPHIAKGPQPTFVALGLPDLAGCSWCANETLKPLLSEQYAEDECELCRSRTEDFQEIDAVFFNVHVFGNICPECSKDAGTYF